MMVKNTMQEKYKECLANGSALLATNFYNFETLRGILEAASETRQPIILQLTKSSIDYMGLNIAVKMARTALKHYNVEGWLHLDHGDTYELAALCLDAGFDSVMIDASEQPLRENISITQRVVSLAARYNASVEAELGYVAKLGQCSDSTGFTDPGEAKLFVEETGVDALAIAIGSAHGFYKKEPNLDMERLSAIHESTNAALVLHGGSGIPASMLCQAIERGICKINLATEIKNIFMSELKSSMLTNTDIDLRKVFPPAIHAVRKLVGEKLKIVNNNVLQ